MFFVTLISPQSLSLSLSPRFIRFIFKEGKKPNILLSEQVGRKTRKRVRFSFGHKFPRRTKNLLTISRGKMPRSIFVRDEKMFFSKAINILRMRILNGWILKRDESVIASVWRRRLMLPPGKETATLPENYAVKSFFFPSTLRFSARRVVQKRDSRKDRQKAFSVSGESPRALIGYRSRKRCWE